MSMDWSNERYVRFYTRDTVTWKRWTWEARACWGLLLRKVDRSGLLDTGTDEKTDALALMLDIPCEVAHRVVPQWLAAGSLVERSAGFSVPTFLAAQEAKQSDKLRQSESRANRLAASLRNDEAACHTVSQPVTDGHTVSHAVTPAVPSRAVPSQPLKIAPKSAPKVEKPSDPRHAPLVKALSETFEVIRKTRYPFAPRDAKALANMLARSDPPTIRDAWARALREATHPPIACIYELEPKLAHFIGTGPPTRAAESRAPAPVADWSNAVSGEIPA